MRIVNNYKYIACILTFSLNIILSTAKIVAGYISGSYALLADGVHTISDAVSDVMIFVSIYIGSKPRDALHPYGHGKIETFLSSILGLFLVNIAANISYQCIKQFFTGSFKFSYHPMLVPVTVASIVIKEFLYQFNHRMYKKTNSTGLLANAWHNRSDALTSVVVLFSILGAHWGYPVLDVISGVLVSTMLLVIGVKILIKTGKELIETNADQKTLKIIRNIAEEQAIVYSTHEINARYVGNVLIIEIHIVVSPLLTVGYSHKISTIIENNIRQRINNVGNILIHIDPYDDHKEDEQAATITNN